MKGRLIVWAVILAPILLVDAVLVLIGLGLWDADRPYLLIVADMFAVGLGAASGSAFALLGAGVAGVTVIASEVIHLSASR